MESNDWQTVKKKKAFIKSAMKKEMLHCMVEPPPNLCYSDVALDMSQVMQRIHETTENLKASEYWTSCQNCLNRFHKISLMTPEDSNTWKDNNQAQHIHGEQPCTLNPKLDCVCYGLGNFSSCLISLHQLAFLLLLLEKLQIPRCQVYIFDPLFTSLEISVLQKLGMTIVSENEEGKRTVCSDTLFFMLHCGKALYNNLLWKNWSQDTLHKMIIIGNSFAGIEERMLSRILQRDYVYIQKSLKIIEEIPFPDCPQYSDIFNDTSIHWFPMEKLRISPSATWQRLDEPTYQECDDLEIIRNHKR